MRKPIGVLAVALALAMPTTAQAVSSGSTDVVTVEASVETPALYDDEAGGKANGDDPAVWVHPARPGKSLVVATKKEGGLDVYDLGGALVQSIPAPQIPGTGPDDEPSRFNNVDIVQRARIGTRTLDVAIVTDRGADLIRVYAINGGAANPLTEITSAAVPWVFSSSRAEVNEQTSAYGVAAYRDPDTGRVLVAASQRHATSIKILKLVADGSAVTYTPVSTYTLPATFALPDGTSWTPCTDPGEGPQFEGMVIDRDTKILFAAQEDVGIWRIPLGSGGAPKLIEKVREFGVPWTYDADEEECVIDAASDPGFGGEHLTADAEGLTIYYAGDDVEDGYLLASSQGDHTFAVFTRDAPYEHLGQFSVTLGDDPVETSDGSLVVNVPLGARFPEGVFITHDGHATPTGIDENGEERETTNFKFTPWPRVADALDLEIDTD